MTETDDLLTWTPPEPCLEPFPEGPYKASNEAARARMACRMVAEFEEGTMRIHNEEIEKRYED